MNVMADGLDGSCQEMWMRRDPLPWTLTAMNDVRTLYAAGGELGRMLQARNGVEWLRTCELLARWMPPAPAVVADVGGGPGEQAIWLRQNGYQVRHFDLTPLHVQIALRQGLDAQIADARDVPLPAASADAVLILGPLYHLVHAADRAQALAEAYRIVRPGGVVVAAAISRWARPFVRAAAGQLGEPDWHEHTLRTMRDGHIPDGDDWDRCVYLHDVDELAVELTAAGFGEVAVVGVEGPIGPWARKDPTLNQHAMDLARQAETALASCSIHLLACGTRPELAARNRSA